MTSSFPNIEPTDISKYNYTASDSDLSESMNKNIDDYSEVMARHFKQQIDVNTEYLKQRDKLNSDLIGLIPTGVKLLKYHKDYKNLESWRKKYGMHSKQYKQWMDEYEKEVEENGKALGEALKDTKGNTDLQNSIILTDSLGSKKTVKSLIEYIDFSLVPYGAKLVEATSGSANIKEFQENAANAVNGLFHSLNEMGITERQYAIHAAPKLDKLYEQVRTEWQTKLKIVLAEEAESERKTSFWSDIKEAPTPEKKAEVLVNYVDKFWPLHETRAEGWGEAMVHVWEGIDQEYIGTDIVEGLKTYEKIWRDGSKKSVAEARSGLPGDIGAIENRIKAIQTANYEYRQSVNEKKSLEFINNALSKIPLGELTKEKALQIVADYDQFAKNELKMTAADPRPEILKTIVARAERGSQNNFDAAKIKFIKYGYVTEEDGWGISDPEHLEEFKKMLDASQRKISKEEAVKRVKTTVETWFETKYPDKKGAPEDYKVRLEDLSRKAAEVYLEKRGDILLGDINIDEFGTNGLNEQTLKSLTPNFEDWFNGKVEDKTDSASALDFKAKLSKDSRLINLTVPLNDGELKSLTDNSARISRGEQIDYTFWRTNATIKENGRTLSPYEIAQRRLIATGFIDEKTLKPIPERELVNTELQDLLLGKPSPANTLNVIAASEDPEWALQILNRPGLDSTTLYGHTLWQNMEQHKFGSIDMDWMRIGVIDEDLINEYKGVVDFNAYSNPQNMLPEIATVQVEEKLFDMATIGQPVTPRESIEQTGLYKAGVGTRDLIMSALTDEEGNFNAFGRVLERFFTGEGAEDVEEWVRSAPIGRIIDMLDGILEPSILEQIEESTQ